MARREGSEALTSHFPGLLPQAIETLKRRLAGVKPEMSVMEKATFYRDSVQKGMYALRVIADYLENLTEDEIWPLPSYAELLFIR